MNDQKKKICAVVLSAGRGRRMESAIQKQYMCLNGKPMIVHTLAAFERSCVDEIILVAGAGEEEYCRKEIEKFTRMCYIHDVAAIKKSGSDTNHIMRRGQEWKTVSKF